MTAYRDAEPPDHVAFSKHITIAETLLNVIYDLKVQGRLQGINPDPSIRAGIGDAWTNLWDQLREARTLVVQLGRDATAFDDECVKIENPHVTSARGGAVTEAMEQIAIAAANALRAMVPEVTVPSALKAKYTQPLEHIPRELLGGGLGGGIGRGFSLRTWLAVGMLLALLLYAIAR